MFSVPQGKLGLQKEEREQKAETNNAVCSYWDFVAWSQGTRTSGLIVGRGHVSSRRAKACGE